MKTISQKSAYGGAGFIKRKNSSSTGFRTEFGKLRAVMLYLPGAEVHQLDEPNKFQQLSKIDCKILKKEITTLKTFYKSSGIEVIELKAIKKQPISPNLMFARDLFWVGPEGLILSRMGSMTRASEEQVVLKCVVDHQILLHHLMQSPSTFEGADLLWLSSNELLLGINNRTNQSALKDLQRLFPKLTIIGIPLPKKVQHLLGLLQVIAPKKVLIRSQIAPASLIKYLKRRHFTQVEIPETEEVTVKQGMNIVTLAPNTIIMPDDCPELEALYQKHKIKILKTFKIKELRKAAGGIACLTGILKRD